MKIVELIDKLSNEGIHLSLQGDNIKVGFNGDSLPEAIVEEIREHKESLIDFLKKYQHSAVATEIPAVEKQEDYAISSAQRRLWIISQDKAASIAYNLPLLIDFNEKIDARSFTSALNIVVDRHEILRTVFVQKADGEIRQKIKDFHELSLQVIIRDLSHEADPVASVDAFVAEDSIVPFDLSKGPLFRVFVYQLSDTQSTLYLNIHHIISDAWSLEVMKREIFASYEQIRKNAPAALKQPRIHYKDYSAWQMNQIKGDSFASDKEYWLRQFAKPVSPMTFPSANTRPKVRTQNARDISFIFSSLVTKQLKTYVHERDGSMFVGATSVLSVLIAKLAGQKDMVFGLAVAGREHPDLEDQIGFYINTLPLRTVLDNRLDFDTHFNTMKTKVFEALKHQQYPFDQLLEELNIPRDLSRNPLFDMGVTFLNVGESDESGISRDNIEKPIIGQVSQSSKYDLEFTFSEKGNHLVLRLNFNTDVFSSEFATSLVDHFNELLQEILADSTKNIRQFDCTTAYEKRFFRKYDLPLDLPTKNLLSDWDQQLEKHPERVAVVYEDVSLSYLDLEKLSNRYANFLKTASSIQKGDVVALSLDRSERSIAFILAILKLGAIYLPIDKSYPKERVEVILNDSKSVLLVDDNIAQKVNDVVDNLSEEHPGIEIHANDIAYLIYTSGTSGIPKGVLIQHGAIVNTIDAQSSIFEITPESRGAQFASFSFDASISEIFTILSKGAALYIVPENIKFNNTLFEHFAKTSQITVITLPPAYLNLLDVASLKSLEVLITAGESPNPGKILEFNSELTYINAYGPTEASICATYFKTKRAYYSESLGNVIGKALSGVEILILDDEQNYVPFGVEGEIYIGGVGLAAGYLNREELTQEKFVNHPSRTGAKLYRTGDVGMWNFDGEVEYCGRIDDQLKIRGNRVEVAEIEHVLLAHEAIRSAVVLATEGLEKELVAFFVTETIGKKEVRHYLKGKLPNFMVPAHLKQIDDVPYTVNGKVDKKTLLTQLTIADKPEASDQPETDLGKSVARCWSQILQKDSIGLQDDFFLLGGQSIKAIQLINLYEKELDVRIEIKDLFERSTLEEQISLIDGGTRKPYSAIPTTPSNSEYQLSEGQKRLWISSQIAGESGAYNIPSHIQLDSNLDKASFEKAIRATIERHEILRTVIGLNEHGEPVQKVVSAEVYPFRLVELDFATAQDPLGEAESFMQKDRYALFDLERGPLLRAALIQINEGAFIFYFNMHHIIGDAWSMGILSRDILQFYDDYTSDKKRAISTLPIQFKDYTFWQKNNLESQEWAGHKDYWQQQLSGNLPLLDLPGSKIRPQIKSYNGYMVSAQFDAEQTRSIKLFAAANGGTMFMTLLACWKMLLYRFTGLNDMIIGSPVAGREHPDLADQIGFYVNTLPLRTSIEPEETVSSFLQKVKAVMLDAYSHQMYPFDKLIQDLDGKRDQSRSDIFDVLFTLQNTDYALSENPFLAMGAEMMDRGVCAAKFDLELTFQEIGNELVLDVIFNSDVCEKAAITQLISSYRTIVQSVISDVTVKIDDLTILTHTEQHELLNELNNTAVPFSNNKTVVDLFQENVAKHPEAIALVYEDTSFTYRELDEVSDGFACWLKTACDVQPNDRVALELGRGEWLVITVLSILKSGAAYVPIDPNYPTERKEFMGSDCEAKVLITNDLLQNTIRPIIEAKQGNIDTSVLCAPAPSDLVYVIYTSGSTGLPKGVMMEHHSMTNLMQYHTRIPLANRKVTQFASISFDVSFQEVFFALTTGAELHVLSDEKRLNPDILRAYISKNEIETIFLPTSFFKFISSDIVNSPEYSVVKDIVVAGEQLILTDEFIEFMKGSSLRLHNHYGPAETHVVTTYMLSDKTIQHTIPPIGKPIDNTQIYVFDAAMNLLPKNTFGNLYISGECVSRGYLNRPDLNEEQFVPNPFKPGTRMYKTGDIARWLPDGNIEFLGRNDFQVKIRGFRIEIGEIEQISLRYPEINEVAVIVDKKDTADDSLLLYFVASKTVDVDHLRTFLLHKMPAYMVPSHFIQLEELPLTINGKVDRSRLPQPAALLPLKKESANLTSEEKRLAEIWTNVLGIAGIDAEDSFFNLGGNSLKLIQLSHHIQKEFGKKIVYADLYGNLVLRNQFQLIRASENRNIIGLAPALTEYPLSHSQKRILIASQDREGSIAHHMPSVFLLEGNLDANNLEKAFELVIDRHEILRSAVYLNEQNEPCQKPMTVGETGFSITVSDFRGQNLTEESPEIVALIEQTTAEYLDIANGQVLRVNLFHLSDSRVVLHLVLHHVVGDEWSVYLLTRDLLQAYESLCNSPQVDEIYDPLQIQFKDYAFWEQTNFENSESFDFWKNQFTRPLEQLRIPGAKMDEELSMQGGHHAIQIELEAYRMAKDFIVSCGVSNAAFFASALYTLFSKYANAKDVLLGMISAQRENVQLADQMGPFLNMLPLRLNFEHEQSLKDLVIKTAKLVSGSIKHGHIPLESIREEIYPKQSGNFQIVLNVMNNLEVQASQFDPLSSIQVTPLQSGYESSKFPLTFYVFEQADYFNINIEYQVDKFDQERIVEIGEMLLKVIGEICANPAKTVGDCELFETVELPAFTRVER